jgi:protein TonB
MTDAPRGGRRFVFALAASLLVHAGAVAFIGVLSVGGGREEAPVVEGRVGNLLRPVQITFVPMSPRNPIMTPATTLAPPAPPPAPSLAAAAAAAAADEPSAAPPPAPAPPAPPAPAAIETKTPVASHQAALRPAPVAEPGPTAERAPAASGSRAARTAPPGSPPREAPGDPAARPGESHAQGPATPAAGPAPAAAIPPAATAAEILDLPTPEYPPRSRRQGEQGLVLLQVEVLPDGRPGQVRVLLAPDYPRLVEAAVEATRKATFRPALLDGRPVRSVIEIPFRFRLE